MIKPIISIGSLPTSFLESMSYYEALLWIYKRIEIQDEKIDNAISYMKDNLIATVTNLFNEALENGDITAELNTAYNAETEELTLSISATEV